MGKARAIVAYAAISVSMTLATAGSFPTAALAVGNFTVAAPLAVANAGAAHVSGSLGVTLVHPEFVEVTRTTRRGSTPLADVPVATDGTFAFDDAPGTTGPVRYDVYYAGDGTFAASAGSAKTYERPLPYDVNGDGFAEGVTGSDGEGIGSTTDAGAFYVFPAKSTGITGTGSAAYSQDTIDVPGTSETGDFFGYAQASGDFNHDGYADLAVSAPNEAIGTAKNTGSVTIFYGSPTGLTATGSFGINGPSAGALFGQSLAVGDFNGSGADELAIGAPGAAAIYLYDTVTAGGVASRQVITGSDAGGTGGTSLFGSALSAGDVNGDGISDLAIGSPHDSTDRGYATGAVFVEYGAKAGLGKAQAAQRWSLDSAGIQGVPAPFGKDLPDNFGVQVQLADFNGDGKADLAASAPGAPVTDATGKHEDAGTVSVLFSNGTQISATNNLYLTEDTPGIVGVPGTGDEFGATLASGDDNGDGKADLAIYADAHYVEVIPGGGTTGLDAGHTVAWTQDSPGVPGTDESGDRWGDSLRFENFQGAGAQGLLIGADGENSNEGAITVLYTTGNGLTATGSVAFSQNSAGVPGTAEKGDLMGTFH